MKKIQLFLYSLFVVLLTSCEGMRIAHGKIIDPLTNEGLSNVKCRVLENNSEVFSNENGEYYIEGPFGGCVGDCEDMNVEFTLDGYLLKTVLNPGKSTIFMEK